MSTTKVERNPFIGYLITIIIGLLLVGFVVLASETYFDRNDYLRYALPVLTALVCIIFSVYNKKSEVLNSGLLYGSILLIGYTLSENWDYISDQHKVMTLGSCLAVSGLIAYNKFS